MVPYLSRNDRRPVVPADTRSGSTRPASAGRDRSVTQMTEVSLRTRPARRPVGSRSVLGAASTAGASRGARVTLTIGEEQLVKSRHRVKVYGEVFTQRQMVDRMLDLVREELETGRDFVD